MRTCYDPEIPVNIVDLGLIYGCELRQVKPDKFNVEVQMTVTAPGCGMGDVIAEDVQWKLEAIPGVTKARVELVLDPPWSMEMMTEEARMEMGMY